MDTGKKIITLDDVKKLFDKLISQELPPRKISDLAQEFLSLDDKGLLIYGPEHDRIKIIHALDYLTGVDLEEIDPVTQKPIMFHSTQNFIDAKEELEL